MVLNQLFDINTIVFSLFGYNMSLVEIIGTMAGLISVWLTAKEKVSCWPVGIINIIFFFILFYQVRLYSDMLLQIIFFIASLYGWYSWLRPVQRQEKSKKEILQITLFSARQRVVLFSLVAVCTLLLFLFMKDIHRYLPTFFPQPAAYPLRDAFTAIASIAAQWIMTRKKIECWLLWIIVDVIAISYYFQSGIILVAIEYIIFLLLAVQGGLYWIKQYRRSVMQEKNTSASCTECSASVE